MFFIVWYLSNFSGVHNFASLLYFLFLLINERFRKFFFVRIGLDLLPLRILSVLTPKPFSNTFIVIIMIDNLRIKVVPSTHAFFVNFCLVFEIKRKFSYVVSYILPYNLIICNIFFVNKAERYKRPNGVTFALPL